MSNDDLGAGGGTADWGADDGYNDDKELPPREEHTDADGVKHVVEGPSTRTRTRSRRRR